MKNLNKLIKHDKHEMLKVLYSLPSDAKDNFKKVKNFKLPSEYKNINKVFITGVGGSAIAGDIIKNYLYSRSKVPIILNRSPYIPEFVDENTLVLLISYSGNTKEVLNTFEEVRKRQSKLIIVSSGGFLGELAVKYYIPYINLLPNKLPRAAIGDILYSILGVLKKIPLLMIKKEDILESIQILELLNDKINYTVPYEKNTALLFAEYLKNKTPVILGITNLTDAVAVRWKNQFNENTKLTAFNYFFPELTHNEIVNLSTHNYPDWYGIVLRDIDENSLISEQINLTLPKIRSNFGYIYELRGEGTNLLSRQMNLVYFGDYVSVYLALLKGIDPTPIDAINELKTNLKGVN